MTNMNLEICYVKYTPTNECDIKVKATIRRCDSYPMINITSTLCIQIPAQASGQCVEFSTEIAQLDSGLMYELKIVKDDHIVRGTLTETVKTVAAQTLPKPAPWPASPMDLDLHGLYARLRISF